MSFETVDNWFLSWEVNFVWTCTEFWFVSIEFTLCATRIVIISDSGVTLLVYFGLHKTLKVPKWILSGCHWCDLFPGDNCSNFRCHKIATYLLHIFIQWVTHVYLMHCWIFCDILVLTSWGFRTFRTEWRLSSCAACVSPLSVSRISGGSRIFPGGGANPKGGRRYTILLNFPENCMKSRKYWSLRGGRRGRPP